MPWLKREKEQNKKQATYNVYRVPRRGLRRRRISEKGENFNASTAQIQPKAPGL